MYTFLVVVVEIRGKRFSLATERNALAPEVANTFCLDGAVKTLNVSIVVWASKPGMADSDTLLPEDLLKVATILWAVVALYHSKPKAEGCLGVKDGLSSQSLTKGCGEHGVRHAGMEVNDRVVIQSPTTMWIDVMNRVCLYELARHGDTRTTGIIWAKALLSCAVHYSGTRQCLGRSSGGTRNFSTALQLCADGEDLLYSFIRECGRVGVWSRG